MQRLPDVSPPSTRPSTAADLPSLDECPSPTRDYFPGRLSPSSDYLRLTPLSRSPSRGTLSFADSVLSSHAGTRPRQAQYDAIARARVGLSPTKLRAFGGSRPTSSPVPSFHLYAPLPQRSKRHEDVSPGPGSYSPNIANKYARDPTWALGDRKARACGIPRMCTPGPVHMPVALGAFGPNDFAVRKAALDGRHSSTASLL